MRARVENTHGQANCTLYGEHKYKKWLLPRTPLRGMVYISSLRYSMLYRYEVHRGGFNSLVSQRRPSFFFCFLFSMFLSRFLCFLFKVVVVVVHTLSLCLNRPRYSYTKCTFACELYTSSYQSKYVHTRYIRIHYVVNAAEIGVTDDAAPTASLSVSFTLYRSQERERGGGRGRGKRC